MPKHNPTPVLERLLARICIDPRTGCWLWQGTLTKGYGRITRGRRAEGTALTHVVTYEAMVGLVPEGMELDHRCRVRRCCNPDHLEPVPHGENIHRCRSRTIVCPQGHYVLGENVYIDLRRPDYPQRRCRQCNIESARRSERRRRSL